MRKQNFSLIELLIVVGIMGALTALILPIFYDTEKEAKATVARSKMKDIQRAFGRFYADLLPELRKQEADGTDVTNLALEDIALYGLWPLFNRNHPVLTKSYSTYDPETHFGWHGQYVECDGVVTIGAPTLNGAQTAGTGASTDCKIPVLRDPYGGYYRILCPDARTDGGGNALSRLERLKRMVIICTGPNRKLETSSNNFIPTTDADYIKNINGDDIVSGGDDIVMRLIPTNF